MNQKINIIYKKRWVILAISFVSVLITSLVVMAQMNIKSSEQEDFFVFDQEHSTYLEEIIDEEFLFDEDIPLGMGNTVDIWSYLGLVEEDGVIQLNGGTYDLEGRSIKLSKPIKIIGPGNLENGSIIIENVTGIELDSIVTENFVVFIQNANDIYIHNVEFQNVQEDVLGFITLYDDVSEIVIEECSFDEIEYLTSSSTYGCGIKMVITDGEARDIAIISNEFTNIHGPAAIWLGGHDGLIDNLLIDSNEIQYTESFGVEIYQYDGQLTFVESMISNNQISDVGAIRVRNTGAGAGGIYTNLTSGDIEARDNEVRRVLEVGIEGYYSVVDGNYIEDTGADQLNHPIADSAGIYMYGPVVTNNIIVNPGEYGGIHRFTSGSFDNRVISGNTIINSLEYWESDTLYETGDIIVNNDLWYVCVQGGESGSTGPNGKRTSITDGTVIWDYKKPLANAAIRINAIDGMSDVEIAGNVVMDMSYFTALSGFGERVYIEDNDYLRNRMNLKAMKFLTGYGNRRLTVGNIQLAQPEYDVEKIDLMTQIIVIE